MRHNKNEYTVIVGAPAEYAVLPERPFAVQALLKVDQIASLTQSHFVRETGQLIKVGRIISDSPDARLRKIVKFHSVRQMRDDHCSYDHGRECVIDIVVENNQHWEAAQVLLRSLCRSLKSLPMYYSVKADNLHNVDISRCMIPQ
jgi:hypothetical protein